MKRENLNKVVINSFPRTGNTLLYYFFVEFFEKIIESNKIPVKMAVPWITTELIGMLNQNKISLNHVRAVRFKKLAKLGFRIFRKGGQVTASSHPHNNEGHKTQLDDFFKVF